MSDEREIIEVEDFRVLDVREEPIEDSEPPFPQQPPMQQWSGQTYTTTIRGGGGCCLSFSITLLLVGIVFILGVCFLIYLMGRVFEWALPRL